MRILLINDFIEKIGGVEIYCYGLKDLLEKRGYQVKFIGGRGNLEGNEWRLRRFLLSFFNIRYYRIIKNEIGKFKPDIIHAHSFSGNISPSFLIAAKRYNIPVVVTPHYLGHYAFPQIRLSKIYRISRWLKVWFHLKIAERYINFFICPANIFAEHLKNEVGINSNKVKVVPHFIEWENTTEARDSGNKDFDNKDILYVGRLSKEKGIEYLIQAMSKIKEEHPGVYLHIVGEGNMEQSLKDLANKPGIEDKVIFHSYIPHENLATMYRKSRVFILPSVCMENAPLTLIEAMSQGTPVVTTNIGGQAELVQDGFNGLLVNPEDPEDLAEKICNILDNPELAREMGERGRKIIEENHTPEKHLKKLIEIYELVIKNE
jgi:glycosyltransferase involved in cell wall biosynthesis